MTELQVTINNLKEVVIVGDLTVQKLEKAQRDLEKPKVPKFPPRFFAGKDNSFPDNFVIGLSKALPGLYPYNELPKDFVGRGPFTRQEIQEIITGLQTLLGVS